MHRRKLVAPLPLALLATLLTTTAAHAQRSTTQGFDLGIHFSGGSLKVEDSDRAQAAGLGVLVGYGINQSFLVFLQVDGAEFNVNNPEVDGKWTMGHADLGLRYHFADSTRSRIPYVEVAFSGRAVNVDNAVVQGQPNTDARLLGSGFSAGGGMKFYIFPTLAVDLQLLWSWGRFTDLKVNDVSVPDVELDAQTWRFILGASWWP